GPPPGPPVRRGILARPGVRAAAGCAAARAPDVPPVAAPARLSGVVDDVSRVRADARRLVRGLARGTPRRTSGARARAARDRIARVDVSHDARAPRDAARPVLPTRLGQRSVFTRCVFVRSRRRRAHVGAARSTSRANHLVRGRGCRHERHRRHRARRDFVRPACGARDRRAHPRLAARTEAGPTLHPSNSRTKPYHLYGCLDGHAPSPARRSGGFMMKMRTVLIGVALTMGMATGAFAQGGGGMMARLMDGITLTDSQKTQVQAIEDKYAQQMQQFRQKMRDARQNGTPMDSASMAAMRDTMKKERDEIRAVLTPDQQSKFDDNVKSMMSRRPSGR